MVWKLAEWFTSSLNGMKAVQAVLAEQKVNGSNSMKAFQTIYRSMQ